MPEKQGPGAQLRHNLGKNAKGYAMVRNCAKGIGLAGAKAVAR